jgi:hypothetical protein
MNQAAAGRALFHLLTIFHDQRFAKSGHGILAIP